MNVEEVASELSTEPASIGNTIDALYGLRQKRLEFQRRIDEIATQEKVLEDHLLSSCQKAQLEGARGTLASCSIVRSTVPHVTDWEAFYRYVSETKSFDLLHKRVSGRAYTDRLEAGDNVPGTQPFVVLKLSLTKR